MNTKHTTVISILSPFLCSCSTDSFYLLSLSHSLSLCLCGTREEFPSTPPQNHRQLKQSIFRLRAYLRCVLNTFTHIHTDKHTQPPTNPPTHTEIKIYSTHTPPHSLTCTNTQRHVLCGAFLFGHGFNGAFYGEQDYRITSFSPCQLIGHSPLCHSNTEFSLLLNATVRLARFSLL